MRRAWLVALALAAGCQVAPFAGESPLDRPVDAVWPAVNRWDDRLEREYEQFVARLGDAVEARRCHRLADCLRDPGVNTTYEPAVDARLRLQIDCADLPYVLRAYFSFKRRLPFGFVSSTHGVGRDARYAVGVEPAEARSWRDFATPRAVLRGVVGNVHSGMYRIAAGVENGDFYPLRISRDTVRPGAIFYDPNGHVLVVTRVRADGAVYMIDGHPDGSLTWTRFGAGFPVGTARLGGGFKAFRPLRLDGDRLVRARNDELPGFDGSSQYDRGVHVVDGVAVDYHAWVRASLAAAGATIDPFTELGEQIESLCRDVSARVEAVEAAVAAGLPARPHPGELPWNIYGTEGDWELYSTPSRDARLKAAFRELDAFVAALPGRAGAAPVLRAMWRAAVASDACAFRYVDSRGRAVDLSLDTVLDRLFDLSFDPYHCPERRWGAPAGSSELASCPDDAGKQRWYEAEARLRNRIDRDYGVATPLDSGPAAPPVVDVRRWF